MANCSSAVEFIRAALEPYGQNQATPVEECLDNIRINLDRGLPEITGPYDPSHLKAWGPDPVLSVIGGGPSLEDTYREITGCVAAANGAAGWLRDRGITPNAIGVCDAIPEMTEIIPVVPDAEYYIASRCHPSLFDKLRDCSIKLWHATSGDDPTPILEERDKPWCLIGGGSTIGMRWINLGYVLGFRHFAFHGMDSSFRSRSHAYEDARMDPKTAQQRGQWLVKGYATEVTFLRQIPQFLYWADILENGKNGTDKCVFDVFGDGLLQHCWNEAKGTL